MSGRENTFPGSRILGFFHLCFRHGKPGGQRTSFLMVCVAVITLIPLRAPHALADRELELWIHPYVPATQIIKRFSPLAAYLEEKTGITFVVRVSRDYDDHIERIGLDKADVAYVGPMSYVQITEHYGPKPILASLKIRGKPYFYGVIFVNNDSDISGLTDLAGRSFAFADRNSTMGYLLPRYLLAKAGVTLDKLSSYNHLKSHEDVALAVIGGYFDAGGVKEEVFRMYRDRGLRVLATSPRMPEHVLVTRKDMNPEMILTLKRILLDVGNSNGTAAVVTSIKDTATGFSPVSNGDYDVYRKILRDVSPPERSP